MPEPVVSIVLPTFNRLRHLRTAVESVFAQTYRSWELIVADDGSAADTRDYLRGLTSPQVRLVFLAHTGNPAIVRNAAIARARGRYLAFIDSDDLWAPTKLEVQLRMLHAEPHRRWSYGAVTRIDGAGLPAEDHGIKPWVPYDGDIVEELLNIDALIATPTVVAERSLVEAAGGFDSNQRFCEDYDLWLRLAMRSEVIAVAQPLATVRVHDDNFSQDRIGAYEGWVRLYGKISRLVSNPRLRSLCRARRAESAVTLASLKMSQTKGGAWHTLLQSTRYSWRYLRWWKGVYKLVIRSVIPNALLDLRRK